MAKYELKIAESEEEIKEYREVRRAVFVNEQGIFDGEDSDEYDPIAVPIIAVEAESGKVAGVVRCYPVENGDWIGGRLAVLPEFRGRLGALLVRKAMEEVQSRGCRTFYARIQEQNVKFFERLGWSLTGDSSVFSNITHYDMKVIFEYGE